MTDETTLPTEALRDHVGIIGKTGSGKTYAAKGIVEGLLDGGARVCIIDPTGVWWGLRAGASAAKKGYPVIICGGRHADVEFTDRDGAKLAEIVAGAEKPQIIIDTKGMSVNGRSRFFTDFAEKLLAKNQVPLHLVIDEAHNFMPQQGQKNPQSSRMLHAGNALVSEGRASGLRIMLLSQRPAKLHKDSLTQVETLVAMRLIAAQDVAAYEQWIKFQASKDEGREILAALPSLKTGEGFVWSPQCGVLNRVTFPPIKTLDSSAAPDDFDVLEAQRKQMRSVDPESIRKALGPTAAPQPAKRPRGTSKDPGVGATADVVARAKAQGFDKGHAEGYRAGYDDGYAAARADAEAFLAQAQLTICGQVESALTLPKRRVKASQKRAPKAAVEFKDRGGDLAPTKAHAASADVTPALKRLLDAIAWWEAVGQPEPTKKQVAAVAKRSANSGGFNNNMSALHTGGLVIYPRQGCVSLTDAGRALADTPNQPGTSRDLQEMVRGMFTPAVSAILDTLIDVYPASLHRADVADLIGKSANSGGFNNNVSKLKSPGWITAPEPGHLRASDDLFLEGAAQ